jgi:hypothetical protein
MMIGFSAAILSWPACHTEMVVLKLEAE